jgi:hypothetical protein
VQVRQGESFQPLAPSRQPLFVCPSYSHSIVAGGLLDTS